MKIWILFFLLAHVNATSYLHELYYEKGDVQSAMYFMKRIGQKNEETSPYSALRQMASWYIETQEPSLAITTYSTLARLEQNSTLFALLGDLYMQQHQYTQAQSAYLTAGQLDPSLVVYHPLALAYHYGKEFEKASEAYRKALGKESGNAQLHFDYGVTLQHQGLVSHFVFLKNF